METGTDKRKGLGEQGRQIVHDTAANWNTAEMLAEVRARVQDQGGEFRSRQATAVLEVCAGQLQAIWAELSHQHEQLAKLWRLVERLEMNVRENGLRGDTKDTANSEEVAR